MSDFNRTKNLAGPMPKPIPNEQTPDEWAARFGARPLAEIICKSKHGRESFPAHVHSRRPNASGVRRTYRVDQVTGQWTNRPTPPEPPRRQHRRKTAP